MFVSTGSVNEGEAGSVIIAAGDVLSNSADSLAGSINLSGGAGTNGGSVGISSGPGAEAGLTLKGTKAVDIGTSDSTGNSGDVTIASGSGLQSGDVTFMTGDSNGGTAGSIQFCQDPVHLRLEQMFPSAQVTLRLSRGLVEA